MFHVKKNLKSSPFSEGFPREKREKKQAHNIPMPLKRQCRSLNSRQDFIGIFPKKRETQAGKPRGVAGPREQEGEGAGTIALIYETEGRGRSGQKGRKGQSRQ